MSVAEFAFVDALLMSFVTLSVIDPPDLIVEGLFWAKLAGFKYGPLL